MVTRGWAVKPAEVTLMACVEACPAMKPTASSTAAAGVTAPDDADVLYIISCIYSRIGQTQTCEQILADLLKIDPTHAGACNDLGYSWADQGKNLQQAETLIRQAIKS